MKMSYAIELLNITKRFARTVANDNVTLKVETGTIHALVGENGAGKTTLMETLYGLYQPDSGRIRIDEKDVVIRSPHDSIKLGIGMVHQHFMLVPKLSVLENIVLGAETTKTLFLDLKRMTAEVSALAEKFSLNVPLDERVEDVGVGVQQRIEILKAIYRKANILVLDEPTAVLTPQETKQFFEILSQLNGQGKTIVLITHKLNEVMAISQHVSVMRKGKLVGDLETKKTSPPEIAQLMVGRPVLLRVEKSEKKTTAPRLFIRNLNYIDRRGVAKLRDVSFEVASGEILGIAGIEGNGQSQLVECLTGLLKPSSGSVKIDDVELVGLSAQEIFLKGFAHVPEDRIRRGLVIDFSVEENLILGMHARFSPKFLMKRTEVTQNAELLIQKFDIRPADPFIHARGLSGGNQQKIIMARELSRNAEVIIASQPTRGVDIGGIEFIHRTLVSARDSGKAILLISADLNEIVSLSDRIAVMYGGKIAKIFPNNEVDENELGLYMTGSKEDEQRSLRDSYEQTLS
ncbi:MAG TPA: ABC transporter ATP-binding protein [Candidatus Acidoferrales bacterium]|nr:ABC transporter ATP-binding protein [Candidatus Acidoferrales bacterium]